MSRFLSKVKAADISTSLFTVAFVLAVFPFILCTTPLADTLPLDALSKLCLVLASGLLALKSLAEVWFVKDKKKLIFAVAALVLMALVIVSSKAIIFPAMIFLFVLCAGSISEDAAVKVSFFTVLFAVAVVLFCFFSGILAHEFSGRWGEEVQRWHFGFNYTTHLPNFFFSLALMFAYLVREKIKIWHIVVIMLVNQALYFFTDTKAIYYEVVLLCVGLIILRPCISESQNFIVRGYKKVTDVLFCSKVSRIVFVAILAALALVSVYFAFAFDIENSQHIKFDDLLSGRLYYAYEGMKTYGLTPFGTEITWVSGSNWQEISDRYFFVDSSFVNMLLNYGVIVFLLVLSGFLKLGYDASKNGKKHLTLVLFVLFVHSTFDPQLFDLRYTPFLMLLGRYISPFEEKVSIDKLKGKIKTKKQ